MATLLWYLCAIQMWEGSPGDQAQAQQFLARRLSFKYEVNK